MSGCALLACRAPERGAEPAGDTTPAVAAPPPATPARDDSVTAPRVPGAPSGTAAPGAAPSAQAPAAESPAAGSPAAGSPAVTRIVVEREGGFAGIRAVAAVQAADASFLLVTGQDTARGTLRAAELRALRKLAGGVLALRADYGRTVGAADMYEYAVTVRSDGRVHRVRADDGTMPEPLRQLVDSLWRTLERARTRPR